MLLAKDLLHVEHITGHRCICCCGIGHDAAALCTPGSHQRGVWGVSDQQVGWVIPTYFNTGAMRNSKG
jgi:hypothetical protein